MSSRSGVRVAGPLAAVRAGVQLRIWWRAGIGRGPAAEQLQLMADVSRWLAARDLAAGDLTVVAAERLLAERRASGRSRLLSARALTPLLDYLRGLGVVPGAVAADARRRRPRR